MKMSEYGSNSESQFLEISFTIAYLIFSFSLQMLQSSSESNTTSDNEGGMIDAKDVLRQLNTKNYFMMNRVINTHVAKIKNIPPPAPFNLHTVPEPKQIKVNTCGLKFITRQLPTVEGSVEQATITPYYSCSCGCTETPSRKLLDIINDSHKFTVFCNKQEAINQMDDLTHEERTFTQLQFESRFESGNLFSAQRLKTCKLERKPDFLDLDVECQGEDEFFPHEQTYLLILNPDSNSASHSQWFNFLIRHAIPGVQYTFIILNFVKHRSCYQIGMQVLQSENFSKFMRVGNDILYARNDFLDQKDPFNKYHSLIFKTSFRTSGIYQLVQNFPYSFTKVQEYLNSKILKERKDIFIEHKVICESICGNDIDCIVISSIPYQTNKPVIYVTSRIHPGESQASYLVEGFMNFVLSADGERLRSAFTFKIIPMLNPDGVICGNYRCNYAGLDLNRQWHKTSAVMTPSINAVQNEMRKDVNFGATIFAFVDFHGHFKKQNLFGYSVYDDGFFHILNRDSPYFSLAGCKLGQQKGKKYTGRVVNQNEFDIEHSFCLECSFYGWTEKALGGAANTYEPSDSMLEDVESEDSSNDEASEAIIQLPKGRIKCFTQRDLRIAGADVARALHIYLPDDKDEKDEILRLQKKTKKLVAKLHRTETSDSDEDVDFKGQSAQKFERILENKVGFGAKPTKLVPKMPVKPVITTTLKVVQKEDSDSDFKVPIKVQRVQPPPPERPIITTVMPRPFPRTPVVKPRAISSLSVAKKEDVRISYQKTLDIQKEKQKFDFDFYTKFQTQRYNYPNKSMTGRLNPGQREALFGSASKPRGSVDKSDDIKSRIDEMFK